MRVQYVRVQYAPAPLAFHPPEALLQLLDFSVQLVGQIEPSLFLVAGLAHELRVPVVRPILRRVDAVENGEVLDLVPGHPAKRQWNAAVRALSTAGFPQPRHFVEAEVLSVRTAVPVAPVGPLHGPFQFHLDRLARPLVGLLHPVPLVAWLASLGIPVVFGNGLPRVAPRALSRQDRSHLVGVKVEVQNGLVVSHAVCRGVLLFYP